METFKSIVVDIDASATEHPALDRAARLAQACGARLTIVDVLTPPRDARQLPARVEEDLIARQRQQLAQVARDIKGIDAQWKLLFGRPATALVREVLQSRHDLVVRSHLRDLATHGPERYGAADIDLLRQCPCPVMLGGPGPGVARPRVCGAVHAGTDIAAEQALNIRIVEMTLLLARLTDGTPMLLQAWAPFAESLVRTHTTPDAAVTYVEDVRRRTEADLARLAAPFGDSLTPQQIVSRRGEPEDEIPQFVVSEGVHVLVMGTMARSGIPGLVIGNTAERVLRRVACSVVAVKPDGFVSPVSADGP